VFLGAVVSFVSLKGSSEVEAGLEALIAGVVTAAAVIALMFAFEWKRSR